MANTTKPLTNTEVKQAKPKSKEYNLADGNGLHLRVKPNGTKLWLFNYTRPYTKKRTNLSLGIYPNLSLSEARGKSQEYKSLLAKDIDPKEHRTDLKRKLSHAHINTFEHVADKWLKLKEDTIIKKIKEARILPVITINNADNAIDLARAFRNAGLNAIEITFRTPAAGQAIKNITQEFPDMLVGAGTVLTEQQLDTAISMGAVFSLAPALNPDLVKYARTQNNHLFIPGISTVSEVDSAARLDLKVVKLFPAKLLGGTDFLKSVMSVYPAINFIPTGGINADTLNDYLDISNCIACGGTWLAPSDLIDNNQYGKIENHTKQALNLIDER